MALIPKPDTFSSLMDGEYKKQMDRPYIGMSSLNSPCQRKLWYDFRLTYFRFVSPRTQRIFERGDLEEGRIISDLVTAGLAVYGDQKEMVDDTGHIKGHVDGLVIQIPGDEKTEYVLEIKTMNHKRFTAFKTKGLSVSDPTYWGQLHTYMGELGLKKSLFVVTNKNDEQRSYDFYDYDPEVHRVCMERGFEVLTSEKPPKKIGDSTWFECKFCDANPVCHKNESIRITCRTCKHVDVEMNGTWSCSLSGNVLDFEEQQKACVLYELMEM